MSPPRGCLKLFYRNLADNQDICVICNDQWIKTYARREKRGINSVEMLFASIVCFNAIDMSLYSWTSGGVLSNVLFMCYIL